MHVAGQAEPHLPAVPGKPRTPEGKGGCSSAWFGSKATCTSEVSKHKQLLFLEKKQLGEDAQLRVGKQLNLKHKRLFTTVLLQAGQRSSPKPGENRTWKNPTPTTVALKCHNAYHQMRSCSFLHRLQAKSCLLTARN